MSEDEKDPIRYRLDDMDSDNIRNNDSEKSDTYSEPIIIKDPEPTENREDQKVFFASANQPERVSRPLEKQQKNNVKEKTSFRKHLHLIVSLLVIVLFVAFVIIVDHNANNVNLTLRASGLNIALETNKDGQPIPTEIPIRIRSYNADVGSPHNQIYYVDTVATVSSVSKEDPYETYYELKTKWVIPEYARKKATYTEICALDSDNKVVKDTDKYCQTIDGPDASPEQVSVSQPDHYNRISCAYYVPAKSTGITAWLFGWQNLNDNQRIGCADGNENSDNFSDKLGYLAKAFGLDYAYQIQQSKTIKDGEGSINIMGVENIFAGPGLTINRYGNNLKIALDESSANAGSYAFPYEDGSQTNNSITQSFVTIPYLTIDKHGRITYINTKQISYDSIVGNEVVGVYGSKSGLTRHGSGTAISPYTLSVNIGKGLSVDSSNKISLNVGNGLVINQNNQISVTAPACDNTNPILTWDGKAFSCLNMSGTGSTNFNISANGVDPKNIGNYETINFNGVAGNTTVSRTGNNITYNIDGTAVNSGTYGTASGSTIVVPMFTVDSYGRLQMAGSRNITAGYGITISNTGVISSQYVLGDNGGIIDDGSGLRINLGFTGSCSAPSNSLSWNNTTGQFVCSNGYRWLLSANNTGSTEINDSTTVNFDANSGLTVSKTGNSIAYAVKLGAGLEFDASGNIAIKGLTGAASCSATQKLSWDASTQSFYCATDNDTQTSPSVICNTVYPVGAIYISTSATNPGTLLGCGTWAAYAQGRTLVGNGTSDQAFSAGTTGGASTNTLTAAQMPIHAHGGVVTSVNVTYRTFDDYVNATGVGNVTSTTGNTGNAGSGSAHNNLQPYIVTYIWQRTN